MKKLILFILLCPLWLTLHAQSHMHIKKAKSDSVYQEVQIMPHFNGDINKYLVAHIQYPEVEKEAGIMGTVFISFIVEKDGSITNVNILRGVPAGKGLDKEALRVISSMPKWIAGSQDNVPVRVQFNLPIHFELR